MPDNIRLMPCPFCGRDEAEFRRMGDRHQSCIVTCGWCGCTLESSDEGVHNGSSWNHRAPVWTFSQGCWVHANGLKTAMLVPADSAGDDAWSLSAWECGHTLADADIHQGLEAAKKAAEQVCSE